MWGPHHIDFLMHYSGPIIIIIKINKEIKIFLQRIKTVNQHVTKRLTTMTSLSSCSNMTFNGLASSVHWLYQISPPTNIKLEILDAFSSRHVGSCNADCHQVKFSFQCIKRLYESFGNCHDVISMSLLDPMLAENNA